MAYIDLAQAMMQCYIPHATAFFPVDVFYLWQL